MHSLKTDSQFDFSNQWVTNDLSLNVSKLLNNANAEKKVSFSFLSTTEDIMNRLGLRILNSDGNTLWS